jgi:hypothetical protein
MSLLMMLAIVWFIIWVTRIDSRLAKLEEPPKESEEKRLERIELIRKISAMGNE